MITDTGNTEVMGRYMCYKYSFYRKDFLFFFFSPTETALLRNTTLIESTSACISKPVEKVLLDKVEVITGEEAEHNVLQVCISSSPGDEQFCR